MNQKKLLKNLFEEIDNDKNKYSVFVNLFFFIFLILIILNMISSVIWTPIVNFSMLILLIITITFEGYFEIKKNQIESKKLDKKVTLIKEFLQYERNNIQEFFKDEKELEHYLLLLEQKEKEKENNEKIYLIDTIIKKENDFYDDIKTKEKLKEIKKKYKLLNKNEVEEKEMVLGKYNL